MKSHRKFLQGLTISKKSYFYNDCELRKEVNYLIASISPNQKISLPLQGIDGIGQGERFDIKVSDISHNSVLIDNFQIRLINSTPQHCCLIEFVGKSKSNKTKLTDIALYSYDTPLLEIENKSMQAFTDVTIQLTIFSAK